MQSVRGTEEGAQLYACFFGLVPSFRCEFDAVVRNCLVYIPIFCIVSKRHVDRREKGGILFPSDWA